MTQCSCTVGIPLKTSPEKNPCSWNKPPHSLLFLLNFVFLKSSRNLSNVHVKIMIRHNPHINKHLVFWVYLYKHISHSSSYGTCSHAAILHLLSRTLREKKLIFLKCFLLHIFSLVKGHFWGLNVAPEEFGNNRKTLLVCIARMWFHYL